MQSCGWGPQLESAQLTSLEPFIWWEGEPYTAFFLASMSFFTGQHDRHGIGFIEQRHGAGLWDQARWQADRRRRSLHTGVIQSCRPLSQICFLIWLESGSIALHILFWAEETKNMQHVTERWIFFSSFPRNMQFSEFNISRVSHLYIFSLWQHGRAVPQLWLGHCC